MDDLPAREKNAEQHVHALLKNKDEPVVNILHALDSYRQVSQQAIFSDFESGADKRSARLWVAHTDTRKLLHRALADIRKKNEPVTARHITKLYLQFIKDSQRFYREYVFNLNAAFGGIPELEAAAQKVKNDSADESLPLSVSPAIRTKALEQCHQALIYLGDLSRYRTSDKLDKKPDYGPALGYYGLAASLFPESGMGHHQQAVVALEQRHHLRAIYHLYRAIVVEHPHPNARNNLRLEFDKTNAAWDRGELIHKGKPNDPDGPRQSLIGWFVRLHCMCVKGEAFRGYEELEREVLGQLAAEIKQRPLDNTLMRMLLVNFAAQYSASVAFQASPNEQRQLAFFHFFRLNIRTFTTLLRVFYDDLQTLEIAASDGDDVELTSRLTPISRRILSSLRLCSTWLLPHVRFLAGLSGDELLNEAIEQFWPTYANAVDLVVRIFPIWDLEESVPDINYLLEEDVDTLGFKPLLDERTKKVWFDERTGMLKPRFSDRGVRRVPVDTEMLFRVQDILKDGLFLATDDPEAPVELQGSRIIVSSATKQVTDRQSGVIPRGPTVQGSEAPSMGTMSLDRSEATSHGRVQGSEPSRREPPNPLQSRQAELSRMVDDLVEDDGDSAANNSGILPVTPPQHTTVRPSVVAQSDARNPSMSNSHQDLANLQGYAHQKQGHSVGYRPEYRTSPGLKTPDHHNSARLPSPNSISALWHNAPIEQVSASPQFPPGLPMGTLGSPAQMGSHGHSRVNSAGSIRSSTSPRVAVRGTPDPWSSLDATPRNPLVGLGTSAVGGFGSSYTAFGSSLNQPLLFGAGGSPWSTTTAPRGPVVSETPPHGQAG